MAFDFGELFQYKYNRSWHLILLIACIIYWLVLPVVWFIFFNAYCFYIWPVFVNLVWILLWWLRGANKLGDNPLAPLITVLVEVIFDGLALLSAILALITVIIDYMGAALLAFVVVLVVAAIGTFITLTLFYKVFPVADIAIRGSVTDKAQMYIDIKGGVEGVGASIPIPKV